MSSGTARDISTCCAFTYADLRHCRMLRTAKSSYCEYHRRKLLPLQSNKEVTASLYEPISEGYVPVTGLTQSLARLYACVAEGTVKAKDAIAMTRVAEILLKTIPISETEFKHIYLRDYRQQLVEDSFGALPRYQPAPKKDNKDQRNDAPTPNPPAPPPAPPAPQEAARVEKLSLPGGPTLPQTAAEFARKLGL